MTQGASAEHQVGEEMAPAWFGRFVLFLPFVSLLYHVVKRSFGASSDIATAFVHSLCASGSSQEASGSVRFARFRFQVEPVPFSFSGPLED